jgi:hypothetical protein
MVPNFYGAMGLSGWLVMLLAWAALIATVVWAITRLFPDGNEATVPAPPQPRQGEDVVPPLVESTRP